MGKRNGGTKCLRLGSWIIVYVLLLPLTVLDMAEGDALISSWLMNCTHYKDNKLEEDVDCLQKMLLQLSVLSGKSGETDTVETFVTNVREYGGESKDLEEPYRLTIFKSDIYVQYPLEYIQTFDGFPHEVELFAPDCEDGSKEKNPNCGWLYNKAGEKLKDSQVKCQKTYRSRIPSGILLSLQLERQASGVARRRFFVKKIETGLQQHFFFIFESGVFDETRKCSLSSTFFPMVGLSSSSSPPIRSDFTGISHIATDIEKAEAEVYISTRIKDTLFLSIQDGTWNLQFCSSSVMYPTYQIGLSNQSLTIRVVAHAVYSSVETPVLGRKHFDFVEVTSHRRSHINSGRTMKGILQVHSVLDKKPPLLTDRYLSVPYKEGNFDLVPNTNLWLALPTSFYTLDGSDCDKIGISYKAFRFQVQPCSQVFQSCFGKQLHYFAKEETERLAHGEKPVYSLSRYGKMFASFQTCNPTLNLLSNQTVTSLISLELKADDLKFFVHSLMAEASSECKLSPGKIMDASIEPSNNNLSGGLLKVEILNTGRTTANFTLHTEECPLQLKMSTVEVKSLKQRNALSSFTFNLSETDDISPHNGCRVFLEDNMGDRTDVYEVKFDYSSREEPPYLIRADEDPEKKSWSEWFWSLFDWSKWFAGFTTTFRWCYLWCPNSTLLQGEEEAGDSQGPSQVFRCEHEGEGTTSAGGLKRCPDPPTNATGILSIFNWTPCGECRNIARDLFCYITTFCWREIAWLLFYIAIIALLGYIIFLLWRFRLLWPIIRMVLSIARLAFRAIRLCIKSCPKGKRDTGGSDSGRSDSGGSSDYSDDDDGGGRRRRRKRKRIKKIHHGMKKRLHHGVKKRLRGMNKKGLAKWGTRKVLRF